MPDPTKSAMVRIREAWPIITFCIAAAVAISGGWFDLKSASAQNATLLGTFSGKLVDLKLDLAAAASKMLTDAEHSRAWASINTNSNGLTDMERSINALTLSDANVNAKIELEVERLRNEIQRASAAQQMAINAQTSVLNQILDTVKSD